MTATRRKATIAGLALAIAGLAAPATVRAEAIRGLVVYDAGARNVPLGYINVSVCPAAGGRCRSATTDTAGRFYAGGLQPGSYVIRVYWRGKTYTTRTALGAGQTKTIEISLRGD